MTVRGGPGWRARRKGQIQATPRSDEPGVAVQTPFSLVRHRDSLKYVKSSLQSSMPTVAKLVASHQRRELLRTRQSHNRERSSRCLNPWRTERRIHCPSPFEENAAVLPPN